MIRQKRELAASRIGPRVGRFLPVRERRIASIALSVWTMAACASGPAARPAPAAGPGPDGAPGGAGGAPPLPPVPSVSGAPLAIRVRYPADSQVVTSRDSNFVHGSIGSGDATLRINGVDVPVHPNGAFIAWLPNPPAPQPRYDLVAIRGADTARRTLVIRYPAARPALAATGRLRVDSATVSPSPSSLLRYRSDEPIRVSVRAPYNAGVWVEVTRADTDSGRARFPLVVSTSVQTASSLAAAGAATVVSAPRAPTGADAAVTWITDVPAGRLARGARLVIARDADTVRLPLAVPLLSDNGVTTMGVLRSTSMVGSDTDRVVIGRPTPDGTYKWLLLSGTIVPVTGRQGTAKRVRLDSQLEVWVSGDDVVELPEGTPMPRRVTGGFRITPSAGWVDVSIPVGDRPAYFVEPDGKSLTLTLYNTQASPEISPIIGNDTLVRRMSWIQEGTDRLRITFTLSQPVYGWLALYDDARRAFVLRLRRIPDVDPARPLAGLTIAVDAGHPPAGATGPTGLYEGNAVLPVAELVASLLRERGATPVMTRTTNEPLGLIERTVTARRANADAFVSIHLNALPDGVNPFAANGTSTLFFHQPSEPLAREVQFALMRRFPLRDLGVHYQNLAVARPTWYPSILAEGVFVMMPEQEAAMRNPEFQRRYAEALVEGLERYFRELARR